MINQDLINSVDLSAVRHAVMGISTRNQQHPPSEQVVAAAAYFILIAEAYGVHVGTALHVAGNVMSDEQNKRRPEFKAAIDYINNEIVNPSND